MKMKLASIKQNNPIAFWICLWVSVVVLVAAVAVTLFFAFRGDEPISPREAYTKYCHPNYATYAAETDGLTVDTNPTNQKGVVVADAYTAIQNLNREYNLPDSLLQDMKATAQADGWQTLDSKQVMVMWNNHSVRGLEVVYYGK